MRNSPDWLILDSVDSTQAEAAKFLDEESPKVILALEQAAGKGRFGRIWHSPKGESLSMSLILREQKGHSHPWLLGMALACAAAGVLHCRLRWPNDLFLDGRKLGGILTEIVQGVPILGIGVNLSQTSFPTEIAATAISLAQHRSGSHDPLDLAPRIVSAFRAAPPPQGWKELAPVWDLFDDTLGKKYRLPDGEEATAIGIGPQGELLATVNGEPRTILAADAILG